MSPAYQAINLPHDIPDLSKPFALTTGPGTDVWDKPPSTHSFNAPIVYQTTTVGQFKRARVTVSADWKDKYDQGGLVLVISPESESRQWVKSGIEQEQGRPNLGTVATPKWSDWSLLPLSSPKTTLEIEVSSDGSLWVYQIDGSSKIGLREVTWWATIAKDATLWVGPYVAKPASQGESGDLMVQFEELSIELN